MHDLNLKAVRAAPPRFEHGFEAPQASVISKLHYRATPPHRPPQYKREGEPLAGEARVHWRRRCARDMAVDLQRKVEFSMIDMANVAYYPRIFDLAHKVFEQAWEAMCDVSYPSLVNERRVGFPVVSLTSIFHAPLRYGDTITASVAICNLNSLDKVLDRGVHILIIITFKSTCLSKQASGPTRKQQSKLPLKNQAK